MIDKQEEGDYSTMKAIRAFFKFIGVSILILMLLAACAVAYARFVEPNLLTVTKKQDSDAAIKKEITVAIFADTHFGFQYDLNNFHKLIEKVNENPPDILLFGGDLIDDLDQFDGSTKQISAALSLMKAKEGKYAVFGNHDYGGGAEWKYEDIMEAGGFQVLKNETVNLDPYGIRLIAIDDVLIGYGNAQVAQSVNQSKYNLVLCHEPDVADELADSNVNFMLAGHTHGGQIRVPVYTKDYLPSYGERYVKGSYSANHMSLYVTSGVGTTIIPARFLALPELTYLVFSPEPDS